MLARTPTESLVHMCLYEDDGKCRESRTRCRSSAVTLKVMKVRGPRDRRSGSERIFWCLQFLCLKNIRTFLTCCCDVFGLKKSDLFDAFDLFDVRDFGKVTFVLVSGLLSVFQAFCCRLVQINRRSLLSSDCHLVFSSALSSRLTFGFPVSSD